MKYLRKFDERLSPETYKRAGEILKDKGKSERGSRLINYHNELTSSFYQIGNTSFNQIFDVTRLKSNFYYGDVSELEDVNIEKYYVDDLVTDWINGKSNLSFTINLEFIKKDSPDNLNYDNSINFLNLVFVLNSWSYGKSEFELDYDLKDIDIYDFYKKSHKLEDQDTFDIYLKPGFRHSNSSSKNKISSEFNFFNDRKNALRFKKDLLELIEKQHKNEIMDIFSLIIADVEEWDKLVNSIKKIRVNNIYVDKIDKRIISSISENPINL